MQYADFWKHWWVSLLHAALPLQSTSKSQWIPDSQDGFPDDNKQNAPSAAARSPLHEGYGWPRVHTQSVGSCDAKHASPPAGLPPHAVAAGTPLRHHCSSIACAPAGKDVPQPVAAVAKLWASIAH